MENLPVFDALERGRTIWDLLALLSEDGEEGVTPEDCHIQVSRLKRPPEATLAMAEVENERHPPGPVVQPEVVPPVAGIDARRQKAARHD